MATDQDSGPAPAPIQSTINLLREVEGFLTFGHPMSKSSADVLRRGVLDYGDRVRIFLTAMGMHKQERLLDLVAAADLCQRKLTDKDYIRRIANSPQELRRHLALLKEIEAADLEFLKSQASTQAEKEGFSRDPSKQYDIFFGANKDGVRAVLPSDMSADERRRTRAVLEDILGLMEGKKNAEPPTIESRVLTAPSKPDGTVQADSNQEDVVGKS